MSGRDQQRLRVSRGHVCWANRKEIEYCFPTPLQSPEVLEIPSFRSVQLLQNLNGGLLVTLEAMWPSGDKRSNQSRRCQQLITSTQTCLSPVRQRGGDRVAASQDCDDACKAPGSVEVACPENTGVFLKPFKSSHALCLLAFSRWGPITPYWISPALAIF